MEQAKAKPKRYLETKFARAASVIITAHRYRDNPAKMAEFIENNLSYFPNIDDNMLDMIREGNPIEKTNNDSVEVPVFAGLNEEENAGTR